MGPIFEIIVSEYLLLPAVRRQLPVGIREEGRWWGSDPETHQEVEIDYIGLGTEATVLCEAKWRNELLSDAIYLISSL